MTCQFCQTWNTDDDHRCRRCGRRIRTSPGRISPRTYPIAATATAPDLEFDEQPSERNRREIRPDVRYDYDREPERAAPASTPQSFLFDTPVNEPRVISFDSITSPQQRQQIHARAAGLSRPAPPKVERVESTPRQSRRSNQPRTRRSDENQQAFDFQAQQEAARPPASTIICDSAVAPAGMRLTATLVDAAVSLAGILIALAPVALFTNVMGFDKTSLLLSGGAALLVFAGYRLLWIAGGRDSIGMSAAHLRLVDFHGRPPARRLRYLRLVGSILSVLAAGLGVVWALFDEDGLTWHDHISDSFPTPEE